MSELIPINSDFRVGPSVSEQLDALIGLQLAWRYQHECGPLRFNRLSRLERIGERAVVWLEFAESHQAILVNDILPVYAEKPNAQQ